jgi:capsid protein
VRLRRPEDARHIGGTRPDWSNRLGGFLDRMVGVFAPRLALRRMAARHQADLVHRLNAYRGADKSRLREGWIARGQGPDDDLLPDLPTMRERCRERVRNDPSAAGILNRVVNNVIGEGLRPEPEVDAKELGITESQAEEWETACQRVWRDWVPHADSTGRLDYYGLQRLQFRQVLENGDVGLHPIHIIEPGRRHPLALELIESDRIDSPLRQQSANGNRIHMGVELGGRGEPVAYHVMPGYPTTTAGYHPTLQTTTRVPRWAQPGRPGFIHAYFQRRPGQSRGEPLFAPVLALFEMLDGNPLGAADAMGETQPDGQRFEDVEPGAIEYLNPGEKISVFNPNRPGTTFDSFVTRILRLIGAGVDLPYEIVALDFQKVNYTSSRSALLEARRTWACHQGYWRAAACQPVYRMVIEDAFVAGQLPAVPGFFERIDAWTRAEWIPPTWGWVDPEAEIKASVLAIQANLSTLSEECSGQGRDVRRVVAKRKREEQMLKAAGLPPMAQVSVSGASPSSGGGAANEGKKEPAEPAEAAA